MSSRVFVLLALAPGCHVSMQEKGKNKGKAT
jgi:hypothetical protein